MLDALVTTSQYMVYGLLCWMAFGTLVYLAFIGVSACVGRRRTRRYVDAFNGWLER